MAEKPNPTARDTQREGNSKMIMRVGIMSALLGSIAADDTAHAVASPSPENLLAAVFADGILIAGITIGARNIWKARHLNDQVTRLREGRQHEYHKAKRHAINVSLSRIRHAVFGRNNSGSLKEIAERHNKKAPGRLQQVVDQVRGIKR
jgi:hypothetical protein